MKKPRKLSEREKKLRQQGWTRQFVASEPRLSEAVELYQATGYDVLLEPMTQGDPIHPEGSDGCTACFDGFEDQYKIIFTRPKKEGEQPKGDLW
jgi:hypothetical protein